MDQKHCPECGAAVDANAKFCPECGVPLTKAAKGATGRKGASAAGNSVRDTLIIVGVLAVVAVAYFLLKKEPATSQPPQQMTQMQGQNQNPATAMPGDTANPHGPNMEIPLAMLDSLPKDFNTLVSMANKFHDDQNFAVATEIYKRALALKPDDQDVRVDYGACLDGMGLPNRAAEEFKKVLQANPNHPIANFNLALVEYKQDHRDSAKAYFNKYLKIDPQGSAAETARQFLKELGG